MAHGNKTRHIFYLQQLQGGGAIVEFCTKCFKLTFRPLEKGLGFCPHIWKPFIIFIATRKNKSLPIKMISGFRGIVLRLAKPGQLTD